MTRRKTPLFTVSVAAELAGMHAQTLRQYDRMGLVRPKRTQGGGRRYSLDDIDKLQEVQRLSQEEGINLAGIVRIFELEKTVERLKNQLEKIRKRLDAAERQRVAGVKRAQRIFAAGVDGDVVLTPNEKALRDYLRSVEVQRRDRKERMSRGQVSESRELTRYRGSQIEDLLRFLTRIQ